MLDDWEAALAWEDVVFKISESNKHSRLHRRDWLCPKCEGKLFTIPYPTNTPQSVSVNKSDDDEMEFLVLICDRCGQIITFEGCSGECASLPRSRCEVCGKYYCSHCGITVDIEVDEKHVKLRYCNDHIPEWYKNR